MAAMPKSQTARRTIALFAVLVAFAAMLFAAAVAIFPTPDEEAAASAIGGPFRLAATDGRMVTEQDLVGRPTLIFFGFTRCPDVCPTALAEVSAIFGRLGPQAKVGAYFVTVDPERDTTAALADFLSSFDKRIVGLSGDPQALEAMRRAYRVYAKKVPTSEGDYTMDHTAIVYLMDKKGRFVNAFNIARPADEAARDLARYL